MPQGAVVTARDETTFGINVVLLAGVIADPLARA
jgi:hypothetical protein